MAVHVLSLEGHVAPGHTSWWSPTAWGTGLAVESGAQDGTILCYVLRCTGRHVCGALSPLPQHQVSRTRMQESPIADLPVVGGMVPTFDSHPELKSYQGK